MQVEGFTYYESFPEEGADTLVITYGVTARAARTACKALKAKGTPVSLLVLKTLWPVPEKLIREAAAPFGRVLVAEMNMGQYVHEIQRVLPDKAVAFKGQMNGKLITPRQIEEVLTHA